MFYVSIASYLRSEVVLTYQIRKVLDYSGYILGVLGLVFTIYYIVNQRKKVQTYIGISLRYIWIALVAGLILINLIQFNVLHKIIFELQHPIFMVIFAFAIVVSGGILRFRIIVAGGIIFGILAYISSFLPLHTQLLVEALAWLIAFIIPGHFLYSKRNQ